MFAKCRACLLLALTVCTLSVGSAHAAAGTQYVTFLSDLFIQQVAADGSGHAYVWGIDSSAAPGAGYLLVKMNETGSAPVWIHRFNAESPCTLGGHFAVTAAGDVYGFGGNSAGQCLAKINADGTVAWARPVDGGDYIALAPDGSIFAAYETDVEPQQQIFHCNVAKFDSGGNLLVKMRFGGEFCNVSGIAVDGHGTVHVGGLADADFPVSPGAFSTAGAVRNVFVIRFSSTLASVISSTRFGPPHDGFFENTQGIAIDAAGNAFVSGRVMEPGFPLTPDAVFSQDDPLKYESFRSNVFLSKVGLAGELLYSTYLTGEQCDDISCSEDRVKMIAGVEDHVWVVGTFERVMSNPQPVGPQQVAFNGVAWHYSSSKNVASTQEFIGGFTFDEQTRTVAVAVDPRGNAYVLGHTTNPTFTATAGAWDTTFVPGFGKPWLAKIVVEVPPAEMLANLASSISRLGVQDGVRNSLLAKLSAASDSFARGLGASTCNQLKALLNEVSAQSGKKLTASQAAMIVESVQTIQAVIGCH
jgi:hypothetical protein